MTRRQRPRFASRRRLVCERLEPRHLLAADPLASLDDLDSLDSLSFVPIDDPAADTFDDTNVTASSADDPGSLAAYLAELSADPDIQSGLATVSSAGIGPPAPRHNSVDPVDVDVSGILTPRDALLVINHIHHGDPSLTQADDVSAPGVFYTDVNGDGQITAADAEQVIDALNRGPVSRPVARVMLAAADGAEGEAPPLPFVNALPPPPIPSGDAALPYLTKAEVETLLSRAAGATRTEDAIIAIVDRGGNILGVRMEQGVLNNIPDELTRVFAIDGAVAKARTAAFFASNQAPLTSRTIRSLSQTTITEREVESNPTVPDPTTQNPFNDADPISRTFGPGLVAPIGVGGHFPPDIAHTPPVDLFNIELQSRDGLTHPGADGVKGTADDIALSNRFNVPTADLPQGDIPAPESYGVQSGLLPQAIGRGIATLPGGIPLYKTIPDPQEHTSITLVGGIGVFFPGLDGYATHEQGFIPGARQTSSQRLNSRKELEAEYIALAAAGGITGVKPVGPIGGIAPPAGFALPAGRIDLVGITLEVFGPNPTASNHSSGIDTVFSRGRALGQGSITTGENQQVDPGGDLTLDGTPVPEGWIVSPHDSPLAGTNQITQADVERIVANAIQQAGQTRAAIRLPAGQRSKMTIAVGDTAGNILGLYRMHDSTIFSMDVAVAKARNTAYYADPTALQDADKVDDDLIVARGTVTVGQLNRLGDKNNGGAIGTPDLFTNVQSTRRYSPLTGLAFTNRTFRFLAEPRYPSGVDGSLPPVFSILTDPGTNRRTAENIGPPMPASVFTSVMGFDAFHASRNFHDPGDIIPAAPGVNTDPLANQNGIVFFPGSTPLYKTRILVGGFGISGDGVDQDDVVTSAGMAGYAPPQNLRADMVFYRGVRLPFQKFNRNPQG